MKPQTLCFLISPPRAAFPENFKEESFMTLQEQIGQRLVTGFPGTELTEDFRRVVQDSKVANVILFRENIESRAQLRRICEEIQQLVREATGHGAFITIDQEGGIVTRLSEDAVNVPGAMAIAATGDPENAYRAGLLTGRELRASISISRPAWTSTTTRKTR
jgi:beta-N-acetylhexosaminidase